MKKKKVKSAIPIYLSAILWLLLGLVCPGMLLKGWFLAAAALLSAAVYLISSKIFTKSGSKVHKCTSSSKKVTDVHGGSGDKYPDNTEKVNDSIPHMKFLREQKIEADIEKSETMMAGDGPIDKNTMEERTAQAGS